MGMVIMCQISNLDVNLDVNAKGSENLPQKNPFFALMNKLK